MHQIVTGPFAALEAEFLQTVRAQQAGDPLSPVSVLVGSNILASHLKYTIADRGYAVANLRFHTFLDLARHLNSAASPRLQRPRLPHLGGSWILEEALEQETPEVFKEVSHFSGFQDALLDTFRDLRDAGLSPEDLDRAIARLVWETPERKRHLEGLGQLFRRVRSKMKLFHDVDDDFRNAIHHARQTPNILRGSALLVYGIYDVTGQQADLLRSLAGAVAMTYFIPYVDPSSSDFALPFLESREKELGVNARPLPLEGKQEDSLRRLAPRIFCVSDTGVSLTADGSFALVSAPGESRAAVEIVREILRAVNDGVIHGFHEAAVFFRQQDQIPILAEALRLRSIPYFIQGGSSFRERPLAGAVLAIASLERDSFSRPAILKAMELVAAALKAREKPGSPAHLETVSSDEGVATSPLGQLSLPLQPLIEPPEQEWDVASWRKLTNHPRFLTGASSWDAATEALVREARRQLAAARRDPSLTAQVEEDAEEHALSLREAENRLRITRSLRSAWTRLRSAAADWPGALSWQNWAAFLESRLKLLELSEDWPAFSTVLDDLSSLSMVAATAQLKDRIPRERMIAALRNSLAELSYPEGRFQRRGVNLLPLTATRGLRFPLVIVPGLEEGRFPSRLRQDPLLLDSERQGIGGLPLKGQRGEEEKLLFDISVRSAEKRLILMTSRLDEQSDRERIPSDFFLRAAAAARGSIVDLRDLAEGIIPGFRSASLDKPVAEMEPILIDETEVRLRILGSSSSPARVLQTLAQEDPLRLARPMAFDQARWERRLTGFDGVIHDADLIDWVAQRIGPGAGPVSASRLETYAKCPYSFFLQRVLELEGWEESEPAEGMEPLLRGSVIHQILEAFLKEFAGEKFAMTSRDELQKSLRKQAHATLENNRPSGIPDLLWEIERDGLLLMLDNWIGFEKERLGSGLLPGHFEQSFGEVSRIEKLPPYEIKAGNYTFTFRGRIDRIDLSSDRTRARVIDYKIGKLPKPLSTRKATALMAGEKMQLAVYRGALSVLPELGGIGNVRGEFLHLQPSDFKPVARVFETAELKVAMDRLPGILEIIGEGLEGGTFFARTKGSLWPQGHCKFCNYVLVCGKDRAQREERKAGDERITRFLKIREIDEGAEE